MIKRLCDSCKEEIREVFREEEIKLTDAGYIAVTVGRAELCRACVLRILNDEKHCMRAL